MHQLIMTDESNFRGVNDMIGSPVAIHYSLMYPMIIFWEIYSFSVLKPGKELFRQIFSDIYCKITQVPQLLQKITLGDGSPSYLMRYQKTFFLWCV